jgi:hypothetical protein
VFEDLKPEVSVEKIEVSACRLLRNSTNPFSSKKTHRKAACYHETFQEAAYDTYISQLVGIFKKVE